MKTYKKKLLFSILSATLFCLLFLSSCENFLKGENVRREIEDSIAWNNAKDISINLSCKEDMGIIIPESTMTGKLGYDMEIQFIPNTEKYVIKNQNKIFKAVSRKDDSKSLEDYVKFTPVKQSELDKKDGIYRAKVKVIKENQDILICPDCILLPAVTSYTPATGTKNFANTSVVITFNMLIPQNKIKDNISIFYNDIDCTSQLFETPVVSEVQYNNGEKRTQVTIKPKALALRNFIKDDQSASVIDMDVLLSEEIGIVEENVTIPLKQDSNSKFKVRYSSEIELDPPTENIFFVTAHEIELDSAETLSDGKFAMGDFDLSNTKADSEKIIQNKCGSILYIYGKYFDDGSGVKNVSVVEQRIKARTNYTDVTEDEIPVTYQADSENAEFFDDGTGFTTFYIKHPIQSEEGAVNLKVSVKDFCDNVSTIKNFTAMKMDKIGEGFTHALYNSTSNTTPTFADYIQNYKKVRIQLGHHNYIYGTIYDPNERFTLIGKYPDKNGVEFSEQCTYVSDNNYTLELNVDSLNGLPFHVIIRDEFGHEKEADFTFPEPPVLKSITEKPDREDGRYEVIFYDSVLLYELDAQGNGTKLNSTRIDNSTVAYYCDPNLQYYVCNTRYSFYGQPQLFEVTKLQTPDNVVITDVSCSTTEETGFYNMTVSVAPDSWQKFDRIFIDDSFTAVWNFKKDSLTHTISYSISAAGTQHILFGSKGVSRSNGTPINVVVDKAALDNEAPDIYGLTGNQTWKSTFEDADYYNYELADAYNDISYGDLSFENYSGDEDSIEIASGSEIIYHIPVWALEEASKKNNGSVDSYISSTRFTKAFLECEDVADNYRDEYKELIFNTLTTFKVSGYQYDEDSPTCNLVAKPKSNKDNLGSVNIYVAKLTAPTAQDEIYYNWVQEGSAQSKTTAKSDDKYTISGVSLPKNSFVKILVQKNGGVFADAQYIYTGSTRNTKEYDYIIANGSSKDSVVVSSDAPVFVHTLVTSKAYDECKDWSIEEWEHHRKHIGDKYLNFTNGSLPKIYSIPMDIIKQEGWKHYVVVAHFADGSTVMSGVMQK